MRRTRSRRVRRSADGLPTWPASVGLGKAGAGWSVVVACREVVARRCTHPRCNDCASLQRLCFRARNSLSWLNLNRCKSAQPFFGTLATPARRRRRQKQRLSNADAVGGAGADRLPACPASVERASVSHQLLDSSNQAVDTPRSPSWVRSLIEDGSADAPKKGGIAEEQE